MKECVRKDYFDKNMSIKKICLKYKFSVCKFYTFVDKNETRTISESLKIYRRNNKITLDDETKNKISNSLKKCHTEGRHPGWSHINSDVTRRSYPEKVFYDMLSEYGFFNKYEIIEKFSYSKYFLDFAFINEKIDIEIDGTQHYFKDAQIHDEKRNDFLIKNGWRVYRINWVVFCNNRIYEFDKFCEYIKYNNTSNILCDKDFILEEYKLKNNKIKKCSCGKIIDFKSKMCKMCYDKKQRLVERPSYEQLIKEISVLGYRGTGRKYNVSDSSIRKWVKKYKLEIEKETSIKNVL